MKTASVRLRDNLVRAGLTPFQPLFPMEEAMSRAHEHVASLSDEACLDLVTGIGFSIQANETLGMPEIVMFDASQGVHLRTTQSSGKLVRSVAFPSTVCLAASWDRALTAEYARSIGEECRAGGIHVLLGPGVNLYRVSQNGRNFEYLGEDPFLASELVAVYVTSLQQTGTMATVKHFVANNHEWRRRRSNARVSQRALEELYLPAFASAVEAGVLAVMTAYNQLNGEYCGESRTAIQGLLRDRLGFAGLVMTDWGSVFDADRILDSGQDLEMPRGEVLRAQEQRLKGDPRIREMATRVLAACTAMGFLEPSWGADPSLLHRMPLHEDVAYRTACEGTVLLQNTETTLPLPVEDSTPLLVTGNWATRTPLLAGGSGRVDGYNQTTFLEAINSVAVGRPVFHRDAPQATDLKQVETAIVITGPDREGEGYDRPFELPERQNALIGQLTSSGVTVVVILVCGGGVGMPWQASVGAILHAFYPGQEGARAVAEILFGYVNPSGKLPFSIEQTFADSSAYGYIPDGHEPEEEDAHGPDDTEIFDIQYSDDVYVGYRWYDAKQIQPRFCFGHGLSYTSFRYGDLQVSEWTGGRCTVRFSITNTGSRTGAEVAQLYVGPSPEKSDIRPVRELKGFERVVLEPGETAQLSLILTGRDFSYFDPEAAQWTLDFGEHALDIGGSSQNLFLHGSIRIPY
ncbi:MAG: beta-glucosidase family protein [Spirochaetota bacterium]